jgi:pyruvate, orthophosphate dikinase
VAIKSTALAANIKDYHRDVPIDPVYSPLRKVMSRYPGVMDDFDTFLKELSHPYKNMGFIINEARGHALDYFHLLQADPDGKEAADLFVDIFTNAIRASEKAGDRENAVDNLLLYLEKILSDSRDDFEKFEGVLNRAFDLIREFPDDIFFLFVKSFYQIKKLGETFLRAKGDSKDGFESINRLLIRYCGRVCDYWLNEEDPLPWLEKETGPDVEIQDFSRVFDEISHAYIRNVKKKLEEIKAQNPKDSRRLLKALATLPGYGHFVSIYKKKPLMFTEVGQRSLQSNRLKLIFLFHTMIISGLSVIHEETLREINRTIRWLIDHENTSYIERIIEQTFPILKKKTAKYPATALNCILTMGKGVYKKNDIDLINLFITSVISFGFQLPMISGVGDDWQIKVNSAHLLNIRTWLKLIEQNPRFSTRLISYLIIHLSLFGVFIKDTDLFPRDITQLLNSDIQPVYNLTKQLSGLFPVYFNDIGAEGQLRDISTELDEITRRKDLLIHFLRKQSHVESSNRIIAFMEAVLQFWKTRDKTAVEPFVPPHIYQDVSEKGPFVDGCHHILTGLEKQGVLIPEILFVPEKTLQAKMEKIPGADPGEMRRTLLFVSFYKLLHRKYNLCPIELEEYVSELSEQTFPGIERVKQALSESDPSRKLSGLLDSLEKLKELILWPEVFEIQEAIYRKRHFAVDIPSMYGHYSELKFNALGLTFRLESYVSALLEEIMEKIDLSLITKAAFHDIYSLIHLFVKALRIDGLYSTEMENQRDLLLYSLHMKSFSISQYIDIFKGFAKAVNNVIVDNITSVHEKNLGKILKDAPFEWILPKYRLSADQDDREGRALRISEIFLRDRIALSPGLQQFDVFLTRILDTLSRQSERLEKNRLRLLLNYDPNTAISPISKAEGSISGSVYLGTKGNNLLRLKRLNLPVPPGFIISTEVYRCMDIIWSYPPAGKNFRDQLKKEIRVLEKKTGKELGNPANPLLLSVRSGSSISQPGMMDTFLDVGVNSVIAAGLAKISENDWFAWDTYRRFLQCFGMAGGISRDDFDAIIKDKKNEMGIDAKNDFSGKQMRDLALSYKKRIRDFGISVIENPFEQLMISIKSVFESWNSPRAKTYRKIMGISDEWGTAATVQEMVYGNISSRSGAGVFYTHNPRWSGESLRLWGDFSIGDQGEDVVSGLVKTLPISLLQQKTEKRATDIILEKDFPQIYSELKKWGDLLINREGWSPQEIEFTFESDSSRDLHILQTRDMEMRKSKKTAVFDFKELDEKKLLGNGIGVSGGAMTGRIVFSIEEMENLRKTEKDTPLIVVRSDTVPDDIREIFLADGLLTARGGITSHAAVVAHRLEKTCIVGCGELLCDEENKTATFNSATLKTGDFISIDGKNGSVYKGVISRIQK